MEGTFQVETQQEDLISLKRKLTPEEMEIFKSEYESRKKSVFIAYLLWIFLSYLAAHKFYLGKIKEGLIYLVGPVLIVLAILLSALVYGSGREEIGIFIFALGFFGGIIYIVWWFIDLFTLHSQVRKVNEKIQYEIIRKILESRETGRTF